MNFRIIGGSVLKPGVSLFCCRSVSACSEGAKRSTAQRTVCDPAQKRAVHSLASVTTSSICHARLPIRVAGFARNPSAGCRRGYDFRLTACKDVELGACSISRPIRLCWRACLDNQPFQGVHSPFVAIAGQAVGYDVAWGDRLAADHERQRAAFFCREVHPPTRHISVGSPRSLGIALAAMRK